MTSNITLFAKWSINKYTVSFNTNGGSAIVSIMVDYRSNFIPPVPPVKPGFNFDGWYIEAGCINAWDFDTGEIIRDTVLFAKWKFVNSYTVSFSTDGGSLIDDTIINENTTVLEPSTPLKPGNSFSGWFRDSSCLNLWDFVNDKITSDTTLFAKWTIDIYTVSFNTNGGSIVANVTTSYNKAILAPIPPVKSGYTFAGWYKEAGCINAWNFTVDRIFSNTTLYAKWDNSSSIPVETSPHFRLYPNPANERITMEGSNMQQVIIYNLLGKMEMTLNLNEKNPASIDISKLKPGKYLLYIKTRDLRICVLSLIKY